MSVRKNMLFEQLGCKPSCTLEMEAAVGTLKSRTKYTDKTNTNQTQQ